MTSSAAIAPRVAMAAVVLGAAVRAQAYVADRSLWLDEAMLATNLTGRGFADLLKPLANTQGAPVLFLWVERATLLVLGDNERALRLVPLVAGVALVPLAWLVGCRLLGPRVGAAAAVLVAVSPSLVRYSTEVKQYSSDAAIALVIVLLALRALDGERRALAWLVAVGTVAPWASHPATFALAGSGLVLVWRPLRARDGQSLRRLAGVGLLWSTSLTLEYFVSLRELTGNEALQRYWQGGFVPRPFATGGTLQWLGGSVIDFAGEPAAFRFGALALAVAVVGVVVLARHRPVGGWLVLAPLPFLLAAAALKAFPFQGRVVLFLVPLFVLLVASPLAIRRWPVAAVVIALVALPQLVTTIDRLVDPLPFPATRSVLRYVRDHRRPSDELWLVDPATPPYRYYATKIGVVAQRQLDWLPDQAACRTAGDRHLRPGNVSGRVWVVHAYSYGGPPGTTGNLVRSQLDALARRVDTHLDIDASATLYDFNALPSDIAARHVEVSPGHACLRATDLAPVPPSGLHTGPFGAGRAT